MPATTLRAAEVEAFILQHVLEHPRDIARVTAERFGISRQAVNNHLKRLLGEGKLVASGATRSRSYAPAILAHEKLELKVSPRLEEDRVWSEQVATLFRGTPKNVEGICHYGFTEMLNNVIDHSGSTTAEVAVTRSSSNISILIRDHGAGIFTKIARELHLDDERHAVLELAKGKLTTDPQRHTGEGIFFTSRMCDQFNIVSGELVLACVNGESWLLDNREPYLPSQGKLDKFDGTLVRMQISAFSSRTASEVFDRYTVGDDDYGFTRTRVPVALARYGEENLISRSQAKRLLARFERFKEVMLDFAGVEMIGQAFADEIFRVFQKAHPEVHLDWINATADVEKMIRRARSVKE